MVMSGGGNLRTLFSPWLSVVLKTIEKFTFLPLLSFQCDVGGVR